MRLSPERLSGEQMRAARAMARISQAGLARRCGLSLETIRRLERIRGPIDAGARTLIRIVDAFRECGIEFEVLPGGEFGMRMANGMRPLVSDGDLDIEKPALASPIQHQLTYFSTAVAEDDHELGVLLAQIQAQASIRNQSRNVNGVLLACEGRFLQMLQGPKDVLLQLYGLIAIDPRHRDLSVIESSDILAPSAGAAPLVCLHLNVRDDRLMRLAGGRPGFHPEDMSPIEAKILLTLLREPQAAGAPADALKGRGRHPGTERIYRGGGDYV